MLLAAALALGALHAHADDWVSLGSTDTGFTVQVKAGSMRLLNRYDGEPVVLALFQVHDPRGNVTYERKYVTLRDCRKGAGELVTLGAGEDTSISHISKFTAGGESAASNVADILCMAARDENDRRRSTAEPA
ncbi:MAG TPA: hypothetical protein VH934_18680 [Xanthobacteraceae bacterium]|jgi:hypothetical protein